MRNHLKAGVAASGLVLLSCAGEPVERELSGLWYPSDLPEYTTAKLTLVKETDGTTAGQYEVHWLPAMSGQGFEVNVLVNLVLREDPFGGFSIWHSAHTEQTDPAEVADTGDCIYLLCSSCTASSTTIECETAAKVPVAETGTALIAPEFALGCRFERPAVHPL